MKFVRSYFFSRVTHFLVGRPYQGPYRRHAHVGDLIGVAVVMCGRIAVWLEFDDGTPCIDG